MGFDLIEHAGAAGRAREEGVELPGRARCKVAGPVPKSEADSLYVTPIGYSSSAPYEVAPGHWEPHGSVLPDRHTVCVVVFDHQKDPWVVGWEGTRSGGVLWGHGEPAADLGLESDLYFDIDSRNVYGPKAGGVWPGFGRLMPFNAAYPPPDPD